MATARQNTWGALAAAALLLTAAALLFAPLAQAAPAWTAPSVISGPAPDAVEQQTVIDEAGDAVSVWVDGIEATDVIEASAHLAGGEWSPPQVISAPGQRSFEPRIAITPSGEALAGWAGSDEAAHRFAVVATWTAAAGWSEGKTISPAGVFAEHPRVAIDRTGDAVAVWVGSGGGLTAVESAIRPQGGEWMKSEKISDFGLTPSEPEVAIDPAGDAVAVWIGRHVEARMRPAGMGWGPNEIIGEAGLEPEVAIDSADEPVAVWSEIDGQRILIESAARPPGGSWSPQKQLGSNALEPTFPDVTVTPGGEALAAWVVFDGRHKVIEAKTRGPGANWSPGRTLSKPGQDATLPRLASNAADEAVAVWLRSDGTHALAEAAIHSAGLWSGPKAISEAGVDARTPQVAIDPAGEVLATWWGSHGNSVAIQAAAFDRLGPNVSGFQVPGNGTVGVPLSFSAAAHDNWSALGQTKWDFGDGGSGDGLGPSHTYRAPGTYKVTLTTADALGNQTTASGTVTIAPATGPVTRPIGKKLAKAAHVLTLQGHVAMVRLTCPPPGSSCHGVAKLTAKVGKKKLTVAQGSFSVPGGKTATVKLKVAAGKPVSAFLASVPAKGAKAGLSGPGLAASSVLLKPKGAKHGHR